MYLSKSIRDTLTQIQKNPKTKKKSKKFKIKKMIFELIIEITFMFGIKILTKLKPRQGFDVKNNLRHTNNSITKDNVNPYVPNHPAKCLLNNTESFIVNQTQSKRFRHEEMLYNTVFLDNIISNPCADVGPHIFHDITSKGKMIHIFLLLKAENTHQVV